MEWYEEEVRALETRVAANRPDRPIAFYGSSSVRLWATLSEDLKSSDLVNLGFGGSTLEACVVFFDRLVGALKPVSLVVYAGENDIGDGRSPDDVFEYFKGLAAKVQTQMPDIPFGYISIKPSPARSMFQRRITRANLAIQTEIARIPNAYYVDVFSAMLGENGKARPELFSADGLHMNEAGYRLWTDRLQPYRDRIFV